MAIIPINDKVRIGGIDFTILRMPRLLSDTDELLCGQIDNLASLIRINSDISQDMQNITLLHEILHGIAQHALLELGDDEETIIDVFARGLYQVHKDNPGLIG